MMSEVERLLNDIKAYIRISAAADSRIVAKATFDTYEKALVYSKLDGRTFQTKIEIDTGIPQQTVSDWLADFVQTGLASPPDKYNACHRALFTLLELGIKLSALKKRTKTTKKIQESNTIQTLKTTEESQK